jgi:hypothetical protein
VQDRADLSFWRKLWYSVATVLFPVTIPIYAVAGRAGWPRSLRVASFVPAIALVLFIGFLIGLIR